MTIFGIGWFSSLETLVVWSASNGYKLNNYWIE